MRNTVIASAVVIIVATVVLISGAISILGGGEEDNTATSASATSEQAADATPVAARPNCPSTGAGGVELPCLGGEASPEQPDPDHITVVNVWAWWCGPCRDELPHIQAFSDAHPEYTVVGVHADAIPSNGAAMLNDMELALPSYSDTDNAFAGTLGLPNVIPITVVFRGEEQVGLFPTPFDSVAEIEEAVANVV